MKTELERLFKSCTGIMPEKIVQLTSSGSNRTYFRISADDFSCIGVAGTEAGENEAFCSLASHFSSKGINVPRVYAMSEDRMYYLQEDLGTESLFDRISAGRLKHDYSPEEISLLRKTIAELPKIQVEGAAGWDFSRCYHSLPFTPQTLMFDLDYFKYCFLKTTGLEFDEVKLQDDFRHLSEALAAVEADTFMYRDFQSRNVMIRGDLRGMLEKLDAFQGVDLVFGGPPCQGFSVAGIAGPALMGTMRAAGFGYPLCYLAGGLISAAGFLCILRLYGLRRKPALA